MPSTIPVRFRFAADDTSPGSLVEAAVDDITVSILRQPSAGVIANGSVPVTGLGWCRPNPIDAGTAIAYRVAGRTDLHLDLYDVAGRRVQRLFGGAVEAGEHTVQFTPIDRHGRRIPAGVYFLRLETPDFTQVRQVTVIR